MLRRLGFARPGPGWVRTGMIEAKDAYDRGDYGLAAKRFADLVRVIDGMPERPDLLDEAYPLMLFYLADSEWKAGRPKPAYRGYSRLAEYREHQSNSGAAEFAWESAARAALEAGSPIDSEAFAKRAVSAGRLDKDGLGLASALSVLGRALKVQGRNREAAEALREALTMDHFTGEEADWVRYWCYEMLAEVASAAGDGTAALGWADELTKPREQGLARPETLTE